MSESQPGWQTRLQAARWLWMPLLAFCLTRAGIALVAYLAASTLPENPLPPPYHIRPDNILLDVFGSRWDTGFYLSIADQGYRYEGEQLPSVAFFPLFPLFISLVSRLTNDTLTAGILVANAALLLASIFFYRLVALEGDESVAERAVWYLLIFPTSFFGSAIYSESLFLLCAIGALYLARRGYWESAAMLGVMTALTRLIGLIVAPMLLVEWWMQRRNREEWEEPPPRWAILAPALVPLGTVGYMLFLRARFGDPLAFLHASAAWERVPQPAWIIVNGMLQPPAEGWSAALLSGNLPLDNWIDLFIVILFIVLGLVLLRQRRWSEAVFVLLGALIPLNSGLLMSQRRYVWVLFPVFMLLARWGKNHWVDRLVTLFSLLGLGLFTALFAAWYWVG
jgi:Gpi18-like mannosyltransferase